MSCIFLRAVDFSRSSSVINTHEKWIAIAIHFLLYPQPLLAIPLVPHVPQDEHREGTCDHE
jgi:hypothetical protein